MGKFAGVTASLLDKIWLLDWKVTHGKNFNNHSCGFPQKVKCRHEMYEKSQLWKLQKSHRWYITFHHDISQVLKTQFHNMKFSTGNVTSLKSITVRNTGKDFSVSRANWDLGSIRIFTEEFEFFDTVDFWGHSAAFSVEYVILEMDHWVIWVSTWFVMQSRLSNFTCAT